MTDRFYQSQTITARRFVLDAVASVQSSFQANRQLYFLDMRSIAYQPTPFTKKFENNYPLR
jgi:hypothetical protein